MDRCGQYLSTPKIIGAYPLVAEFRSFGRGGLTIPAMIRPSIRLRCQELNEHFIRGKKFLRYFNCYAIAVDGTRR